MNGQHTPGPWIWSGGTGVQRPGGRWVHVETTVPHKEAVANARLIAAAPDLLEALRMVDDMFSYPGKINKTTVRDVVRGVIARATGAA